MGVRRMLRRENLALKAAPQPVAPLPPPLAPPPLQLSPMKMLQQQQGTMHHHGMSF